MCDTGRCYTQWFDGPPPDLGVLPSFDDVVGWQDEDDEFGQWSSRVDDRPQMNVGSANISAVSEVTLGGVVLALHAENSPADPVEIYHKYKGSGLGLGILVSELVGRGAEITGQVEEFALDVLRDTNSFNADAAENYAKMGDYMEEVHSRGGFSEVARGTFATVVKMLASRWATERESVAAARLASELVFGDEPWDTAIFEEAMEAEEDEDVKQARLLAMAGLAFKRGISLSLEKRRRREIFNVWRADATAPAKAFCRAVGVSSSKVDEALALAVERGVPLARWASGVLAAAALPAVKIAATVAAGGLVSATLLAACGLALDWYYEDRESIKLGRERFERSDGSRVLSRARHLLALGAHLSDQAYDVVTHTQVVRVDPFFFSVRRDFNGFKDDTAAQRALVNAIIPPLLQNIASNNKTVILLPATISDDSAQHIQRGMPEFYFKIVNRSHSHPELWAVRRGFEMIIARQVVSCDGMTGVVLIGGSVRQASKIPGVKVNFAPLTSGRDESRYRQKGTVVQRQFFKSVTRHEKFSALGDLSGNVAVSIYSAQDIAKTDFLSTMIESSITKAFVVLNIPVIMMDDRVSEWDDQVLNCRYTRRGDALYMTPLGMPVAGYGNSFSTTMSWVRPHDCLTGYDCTISTVAHVGSSYLLEIDIGVGHQESYETIWKMPDAGYYVLHELSRSGGVNWYTVPAQKFDQTVKFVLQLSGAKNVVEATAGRMLGLEAQIKIGGTVLERSWEQTHSQFSSTMIHAVICAGVDKSDALTMMHNLRAHFDSRATRSWYDSVLEGYKKFFGWQSDRRLPTIAQRGANDYVPVTHWTSLQERGWGVAKPFPDLLGQIVSPSGGDPGGFQADAVRDEGYETGERLNEEDSSEDLSAEEHVGGGVISRLVRWVRPTYESSSGSFTGFKPSPLRQQLIVSEQDVAELMDSSAFNPLGFPSFDDAGSRSQKAFSAAHISEDSLCRALSNGSVIYAPDAGASHLVRLSVAVDLVKIQSSHAFPRWVPSPVTSDSPMEQLEQSFHAEVGAGDQLAKPSLLVDGIAGSAKSSTVRAFLAADKVSCAIVVPTRTLAKEWRSYKLGSVVTRHKLSLATLRGRSILVIDEAYAYTKSEMHAFLWKAAQQSTKVLLLGDRMQQYEDGGEISFSDFASLGLPTLRMCVSNTMPVDALKVAVWAADGDPDAAFFQTRSLKIHSIYATQKDVLEERETILDAFGKDSVLVFKDRAGPELNWDTLSDEMVGFEEGQEENWLSVSRTQGLRCEHSCLLTSRRTRAERWFADQRGLFYVAVSRHSKTMLWCCDQFDLRLLEGLQFGHQATVEGRLAMTVHRERFEAPMQVCEPITSSSSVLEVIQQRGGWPQLFKFKRVGAVLEDWRPWHKLSHSVSHASEVFSATTLRLAGSERPYVETDAVRFPVYNEAKGLHSIRRPGLLEHPALTTSFPGLNRLAVLQDSKDELLDQKNVIERTALPRAFDRDRERLRRSADGLYEMFKSCYMLPEGERPLSLQPSAAEWADGRTTSFAGKLASSDPYGLTAFSVRSQGFLKTQVKVKLKRSFALEENYGQTVLASPADFNAMFGPWSKMFLRNLRLCMRPGAILDSGYSDKELARELRRLGLTTSFTNLNFQADVKRQDTSHTPVTLRLFCTLMKDMGVPSDLCDLYELHSSKYPYASMKAGLYRGEAEYNLGSGDPFTLIRNIVELLTVMLERFGPSMRGANFVAKGDDFIMDQHLPVLPVVVPEVRATQLTTDYDKPPYHAGRFVLPDDLVPDPVRMICKILVKRTTDIERVKELATSFYDRYVPLTQTNYDIMRNYVVVAYGDFEPEFPLSALEMYHSLRDRSLFYELVATTELEERDKLVKLDNASDCVVYASSFFSSDTAFISSLRHETVEVVQARLVSRGIPCHLVRGRQNDFLSRGVWLSVDHAWAVVGLTEYKVMRDAVSTEEQRKVLPSCSG